MELADLRYPVAVLAGAAAGWINTLAGSGTLLTLPVMTGLLGLPIDVANGSNRVGILLSALVGAGTYRRAGQLQGRALFWLLLPSALGALCGAELAVALDERALNLTIGSLFLVLLATLLLRPERWIVPAGAVPADPRSFGTQALLFLVGAYGGFIQAGVGLFLLAALVLKARLPLAQANGVKLAIVLVFTIPALAVFIAHGQIDWGIALLLAAGQVAGAFAAARFATRSAAADAWIRRVLVLVLLASAIDLFRRAAG